MGINDESYVSEQTLEATMGAYSVKTFKDKYGNDAWWCVVDSEGNEVTSLTGDESTAEMDCYALNR